MVPQRYFFLLHIPKGLSVFADSHYRSGSELSRTLPSSKEHQMESESCLFRATWVLSTAFLVKLSFGLRAL
jgi:hypothetical protein